MKKIKNHYMKLDDPFRVVLILLSVIIIGATIMMKRFLPENSWQMYMMWILPVCILIIMFWIYVGICKLINIVIKLFRRH
jgi:hypothetical protein